jgi:hypothetical protein
MIPSKTYEVLGSSLWQSFVAEKGEVYAIEGYVVDELKALAMRIGGPQRMDGDEARDWQNRLNTMVDTILQVKL